MDYGKYTKFLVEQVLRQLAKDHGLDLFFTGDVEGTRTMNVANNTRAHLEFLGVEIKPGDVYELPISLPDGEPYIVKDK